MPDYNFYLGQISQFVLGDIYQGISWRLHTKNVYT